MQIDSALLRYNAQPLKVPSSSTPVQRGAGVVGVSSGKGVVDAHTSSSAERIDKKSKLYEQCQEFESIFVKMMLKEMRNSVDKTDDIMSGGWAEDIYSDMLDGEYAASMAKTAGFGLSDELYKQLAQA